MSYKHLTDNQRWSRNLGIINDFMILGQAELMEKYDCGSETVQLVLNTYLSNRDIGLKPEPNEKQYYANEEEMIIQDYRIEDLTGEEKLILEKL